MVLPFPHAGHEDSAIEAVWQKASTAAIALLQHYTLEDWRQKRDDSERETSQECPECGGEVKKDLSIRIHIHNGVSAGGCHSLKYCCSKSFRRSPICRNCVSIFLIAKGEGLASPFSHRLTVG
jgi:hypothetical protein